ncbi:Choline dehydrogenase protein [Apiospora saccharicola]|uniref:Choline dehydrogenase protein n=1 Tax=Apiospora saccharicola TaxID=335842 RepID=A0ABR1VDB0_9PEZI
MRWTYLFVAIVIQGVHGIVSDTYDYVIVGGGTSGLAIANRLTEDPNTSVLVIERGGFDDKPQAIVPYYATGLDTSVMIRPKSAPVSNLNNSKWDVNEAAVVGGGSVVNGMGYLRGSRADYDAWEALGNPGWGREGLLPYFRKSSTLTPPSAETAAAWNMSWDDGVYGQGPVHTHIPDFQYPDRAAFWDVYRQEPGLQLAGDSNAGYGPGAYWAPSTIDARDMTRSTARKAYYDPVNRTRSNLHLLTGQTAQEILFEGLRTTGVRFVSGTDNLSHNANARKEVIVATGAIQTPQLLQASGIGPAAVLRRAGVQVKKDLPGVGANLQDHPTVQLRFNLSRQSFPNPDTIATDPDYNAIVWAEYYVNKTGPITATSSSNQVLQSLSQVLEDNATQANSLIQEFLSQAPHLYLPEIYHSSPQLIAGFVAQRAALAGLLASPNASVYQASISGNGRSPNVLLKPLSRGTVTYNTLQNPFDRTALLAITRRARDFWAHPALAAHFGPVTETVPGPGFQTDDEIMTALVEQGALWPSLAHPCGTCAMIPEARGGCVGPDLRVHGVEGLRVVDASVHPADPGGVVAGDGVCGGGEGGGFDSGGVITWVRDARENVLSSLTDFPPG